MDRARRHPIAAPLAIAGVLAVSLGAPIHHHDGRTGVDCVACHAAARARPRGPPGRVGRRAANQ